MTDMLVKLYDLPPFEPDRIQPVVIRRALVPEKFIVLDWIARHFSDYWVSEADAGFTRVPVSCLIAVEQGRLLGFACYDVTCRGFFGPTGVDATARGRGLGTVLLLASLHDMFAQGYAYAIIGSVGPTEFYQRVVGATVIPGSTPGIYNGMLRPEDNFSDSE